MRYIISLILINLLLLNGRIFSQNLEDSTNFFAPRDKLLNQILKDSIKEGNIKVIKDKNIFFSKKRDFWKIGASGIVTLAGTISAYLLKNEATENDDLYQQTKNQEYYDKSRKYDIYFGISMVITQIAFSSLMYFLFFE